MRLEIGKFPVTEVAFGDKTAWTDGKLEIDRDGLTQKILEDPRVLSADFDLARPGESVRITLVRDVIEPMVKVSGPGTVYPGRLRATGGNGRQRPNAQAHGSSVWLKSPTRRSTWEWVWATTPTGRLSTCAATAR